MQELTRIHECALKGCNAKVKEVGSFDKRNPLPFFFVDSKKSDKWQPCCSREHFVKWIGNSNLTKKAKERRLARTTS